MRKMHLIGFVLALLALGACSTEQMVGTGAGAAGGYALGGGKGAAAGAVGGGILGTILD
jgi:osmotically inducible lipoprotein OsmB